MTSAASRNGSPEPARSGDSLPHRVRTRAGAHQRARTSPSDRDRCRAWGGGSHRRSRDLGDDGLLMRAAAVSCWRLARLAVRSGPERVHEPRGRGGIARSTEAGAALGFFGRSAIHPRQLVVSTRPTRRHPARVREARELIEQFEAAVADGPPHSSSTTGASSIRRSSSRRAARSSREQSEPTLVTDGRPSTIAQQLARFACAQRPTDAFGASRDIARRLRDLVGNSLAAADSEPAEIIGRVMVSAPAGPGGRADRPPGPCIRPRSRRSSTAR